jgi:hypothetical protein
MKALDRAKEITDELEKLNIPVVALAGLIIDPGHEFIFLKHKTIDRTSHDIEIDYDIETVIAEAKRLAEDKWERVNGGIDIFNREIYLRTTKEKITPISIYVRADQGVDKVVVITDTADEYDIEDLVARKNT